MTIACMPSLGNVYIFIVVEGSWMRVVFVSHHVDECTLIVGHYVISEPPSLLIKPANFWLSIIVFCINQAVMAKGKKKKKDLDFQKVKLWLIRKWDISLYQPD